MKSIRIVTKILAVLLISSWSIQAMTNEKKTQKNNETPMLLSSPKKLYKWIKSGKPIHCGELGLFQKAPKAIKKKLNKIIIHKPKLSVYKDNNQVAISGYAEMGLINVFVKIDLAWGSYLPPQLDPGADTPLIVLNQEKLLSNAKENNIPTTAIVKSVGNVPDKEPKDIEEVLKNIRKTKAKLGSWASPKGTVTQEDIDDYKEDQPEETDPKLEGQDPASAENMEAAMAGIEETIKGQPNYSILIGFPGKTKFEKIWKKLKPLDFLRWSNFALVYSANDYFDKQWGRKFNQGLNLVGTVSVEGRIGKILRTLFPKSKQLNELTFHGTFSPQITNSSFIAELPGKFSLGKRAETSGLMLRARIIEAVFPLDFSIITGLNVKVGQDTLQFRTGITYIPPAEVILAAWMNGVWKRALGTPFSIGNLGVQGGSDITVAIASHGALPIQRLGIRGTFGIRDKLIDIATSVALSSTSPDFMLHGKVQGGLFLEDLAYLVIKGAEGSGRIARNLATGESWQKSKESTVWWNKIREKIPNLGFDEAEVFFSPKDAPVAGKYYRKGVAVALTTTILNKKFAFDFRLTNEFGQALVYMSELHLGPISITGAGPGFKRRKEYAEQNIEVRNGEHGPIFHLLLSVYPPFAKMFIDGKAAVNIFGGIESDTRISFSPSGVEFWMNSKIFDQFNSIIKFQAKKIRKPKDWSVHCELEQKALNNFASLLAKAADKIAPEDQLSSNDFKASFTDIVEKIKDKKSKGQSFRGLFKKAGRNTINKIRDKVAHSISNIETILKKGFNIEKLSIIGKVSEIVEAGSIVRVNLKGTIFGKSFLVKDFDFNFHDVKNSSIRLINYLNHHRTIERMQKQLQDEKVNGTFIETIIDGYKAKYYMNESNKPVKFSNSETEFDSDDVWLGNETDTESFTLSQENSLENFSDNLKKEEPEIFTKGKEKVREELEKLDKEDNPEQIARTSTILMPSSYSTESLSSDVHITLVEGDITKQFYADINHAAIVNAANIDLQGGGGIDAAIHTAAGNLANHTKAVLDKLKLWQDSSSDKSQIGPGFTLLTSGVNLSPIRIIHTIGPDCRKKQERSQAIKLLTAAYTNSLKIAQLAKNELLAINADGSTIYRRRIPKQKKLQLNTNADYHGKISQIVFPSISSGLFKCYIDKFTELAIKTVIHFLRTNKKANIREVRFLTYGDSKTSQGKKEEIFKIYKKILDNHKYLTEITNSSKIPNYLSRSASDQSKIAIYKLNFPLRRKRKKEYSPKKNGVGKEEPKVLN